MNFLLHTHLFAMFCESLLRLFRNTIIALYTIPVIIVNKDFIDIKDLLTLHLLSVPKLNYVDLRADRIPIETLKHWLLRGGVHRWVETL